MLVIRFLRVGKKNQPSFKIVVTDKRRGSKYGRFLEEVGFYNPLTKEKVLRKDRIKHWLSKGVKPSNTVYNLLIKEKILEGKKIPVHKKSKKKEKKPEEVKPAPKEAKPVPEKEKPVQEVKAGEKPIKEAKIEEKPAKEVKTEEKPPKKTEKEKQVPEKEEKKSPKETKSPKEEKSEGKVEGGKTAEKKD